MLATTNHNAEEMRYGLVRRLQHLEEFLAADAGNAGDSYQKPSQPGLIPHNPG